MDVNATLEISNIRTFGHAEDEGARLKKKKLEEK